MKFLVIPGVEWYRASCNGRRVQVVNRKQFALNWNESRRPASIINQLLSSITVFAFVNNAGSVRRGDKYNEASVARCIEGIKVSGPN